MVKGEEHFLHKPPKPDRKSWPYSEPSLIRELRLLGMEPTEAMVQAGVHACVRERDHLAEEGVQEIFRAMIAAARPDR